MLDLAMENYWEQRNIKDPLKPVFKCTHYINHWESFISQLVYFLRVNQNHRLRDFCEVCVSSQLCHEIFMLSTTLWRDPMSNMLKCWLDLFLSLVFHLWFFFFSFWRLHKNVGCLSWKHDQLLSKEILPFSILINI